MSPTAGALEDGDRHGSDSRGWVAAVHRPGVPITRPGEARHDGAPGQGTARICVLECDGGAGPHPPVPSHPFTT